MMTASLTVPHQVVRMASLAVKNKRRQLKMILPPSVSNVLSHAVYMVDLQKYVFILEPSGMRLLKRWQLTPKPFQLLQRMFSA